MISTLLKIEAQKLRSYTPFWIIIILFTVFLPLGYFAFGQIPAPEDVEMQADQNITQEQFQEQFLKLFRIYEYPDIWYHLTYAASWANFLFGLLIIILVTNEISYRTMRQHVIDGLSRPQILISKLLLIVIIALLATLIVTITGLLYGFLNTEDIAMDLVTQKAWFILGYFIQVVAFMICGLFIGLLVKSTAGAIIIFILYNNVLTEFILDLGPRLIDPVYTGWLPYSAMSSITTLPFQHIIQGLPDTPFGKPLYLTLGYSALFVALSFLMMRKRDL